jgi:AcrR family transcriptional regulator
VSSAPESQDESTQRGAGLDAVTNAAREVFAERGYYGTSIREIAKRAGMSMSALYYWYPNKQSLLTALIKESNDDYQDRCERALAQTDDDPLSRLAALVRAAVEFRAERKIDALIVSHEVPHVDAESAEYFAGQARIATRRWVDVIDDGVARGIFRCTYPDDARRTLIAACTAIPSWWNPGGQITVTDLVERYTDIALRVVDAKR